MSDETEQPRSKDAIPMGWARTTLEDIAELKGGLTLGKKRSESDVLHSVPYLRVANVQRGFLKLDEVKTVLATKEEINELRLREGDILFNEGGDRDKLGRGWIWSGELPECIHQNHVFRARLFSPDILPKFVSHYSNNIGQAYFLGQGKQTTNLASISLGKLSKLPILLPPAQEQRRILSKLESLLARSRRAKEALNAIPALLERFRQSVLASAFRGDLTADWRAQHPDVEPASKLLERIRAERRRRWEEAELNSMQVKGKVPNDNSWKKKYEEPEPPVSSALPSLPDGWGWTSIDELILGDRKLAYGVLKPGDHDSNGVRLLKSGQIRNGTIDLTEDFRITKELDAEFSRTRLKGGEVLLNLVGASIGRSAVAPSELSGANVSRAIAVIPTVQGFAEWVQLTLDGPAGQMFMQERKGGSAQPVLNLSEVRTLCIAIPPMAELRAIEQRIQQTLTKLTAITEAHASAQERISTIDESILAKAFRGELVPQDPNDEPASVLLERLRAEREASDGSTPKRSRGRRPAA